MKLDFFLLADTIKTHPDNKLDIEGAVITHVAVDALPTGISVTAVARLLIEADDETAKQPFEIALLFLPPEGPPIKTNPLIVSPSELPSVLVHPEEERAIIAITEAEGVRLSGEGLYRIQLLLNDNVLAERSLAAIVEGLESPGEGGTSGS